MQPEGGILFVRKSGMRALRMETFEDTIDEVLPLVAPFVEVNAEEGRLETGKRLTPGLALVLSAGSIRDKQIGGFVEQGFKKASNLAVGGGPVSSTMRRDRLIEVAKRRCERVPVEKGMHFVICCRKVENFRQRPP